MGTATTNLRLRIGCLLAAAYPQEVRTRNALPGDVPELGPLFRPGRKPAWNPDEIGTFGARYHVPSLAGIEFDLLRAVWANAADHAFGSFDQFSV
jgi:hypothetical protein